MAGEVTLRVGALDRAAGLVGGARDDLDKLCVQARDLLKEVGAHWRGAGAAAFAEVLNQWDENTVRVVLELNDFEYKLRASERNYAQADEQSRATTRSAGSRLDL